MEKTFDYFDELKGECEMQKRIRSSLDKINNKKLNVEMYNKARKNWISSFSNLNNMDDLEIKYIIYKINKLFSKLDRLLETVNKNERTKNMQIQKTM
jgi:hypothetical protein